MATASENEAYATGTTQGKVGLAHAPSGSSSEEYSDAGSGATGHCSPAPQKSRGRPPTTGHYVGLAKAQAELNRLKEAELRRVTEKVAMKTAGWKQVRTAKNPAVPNFEDQLASDINEGIQAQAKEVLKIAQTSKNLGGTYQTAMEEAAISIMECSALLAGLCDSEECRKLKAEYVELKAREAKRNAEIDELRKELSSMKEELKGLRQCAEYEPVLPREALDRGESEQPQKSCRYASSADPNAPLTPGTLELAIRGMRQEMQEMFKSCMEMVARDHSHPAQESVTPTANIVQPTVSTNKRRKKRRARKSLAALEVETAGTERTPPQTLPALGKETWAGVAKRGPTKRGGQNQALRGKTTQTKLAVPRTSAIVIALQPEAVKNGIDYETVVSLAREQVDIDTLDIPYIKYKETATGTRKLEIPGAASGKKADQMAEKLRAFYAKAIGEGMVNVSRPMKRAELRVTGLDESITKEEVAAAVAAKGLCPVDQVKVEDVRRAPYGTNMTWVSCPVTAAKRVTQERRLMFGWLAAQVKLMQPSPPRCFRCLEIGHIKQRCKSAIDRSELCFRCGQDGHKAAQCFSAPHCPMCDSAQKPAEHRLGSRACRVPLLPPPSSGRGDTSRR